MIKKLIILTVFLILQKYGYCQRDTTYTISGKKLAQIYTDLTICDTSKAACLRREELYKNKITISETYCNEAMYNDSIIITELTTENSTLREDKNILWNSNKNLEKSNKRLKLAFSSSLIVIIIETLIILL